MSLCIYCTAGGFYTTETPGKHTHQLSQNKTKLFPQLPEKDKRNSITNYDNIKWDIYVLFKKLSLTI